MLDDWFGAVDHALAAIRAHERTHIEAAGARVAEAIARRGVWAVHDTGHLVQHEAAIRAGGLLGLIPFDYALTAQAPALHRADPAPTLEQEIALAELALARSRLRAGDVLLINSNSGRSLRAVVLAECAAAAGLHTIAVVSRAQLAQCAAEHPAGYKLDAVAGITIDNHSPAGDAAVPRAQGEPINPLSGLTSAYILWSIQAAAVADLSVQGVNPAAYRSVHVGGQTYIDQQVARYQSEGR